MQLFHLAFNVYFKSMFHGHFFNLHTILLKIEVGKQFIRKTISAIFSNFTWRNPYVYFPHPYIIFFLERLVNYSKACISTHWRSESVENISTHNGTETVVETCTIKISNHLMQVYDTSIYAAPEIDFPPEICSNKPWWLSTSGGDTLRSSSLSCSPRSP